MMPIHRLSVGLLIVKLMVKAEKYLFFIIYGVVIQLTVASELYYTF